MTFMPLLKESRSGRQAPAAASEWSLSEAEISMRAYLNLGRRVSVKQAISALGRYMRTSLAMSRSPPSATSRRLLMYLRCTLGGRGSFTSPSSTSYPTYCLPSRCTCLVSSQSPKPISTTLLTPGRSTALCSRTRQSMLQQRLELMPSPHSPLLCRCSNASFMDSLSAPTIKHAITRIPFISEKVMPRAYRQFTQAHCHCSSGCAVLEGVALRAQQQYFGESVSMYRINGLADFMQLQNEECSCFGPAQQQDQHFLAKHKTASSAHLHPDGPALHASDHKAAFKKSLKKPLPSQAVLHAQPPQRPVDDPLRTGAEFTPQQWRQECEGLVYSQERGETAKNYGQNHEMMAQQRRVFPQVNAVHQLQNKMPLHCTGLLPAPHSFQALPVKVAFGTGFASKTAGLPPQTSKVEPPHDEISDVGPLSPPEEGKGSQKQRQLQKIQSLQHIHCDFEGETPSSPRKSERHSSKPPSSERKVASRASLNCEAGKSQLMNLKKMDDVMEICSQAGSSEGSSSDESIVVGRLNEYCSMVEQKGSVEEKSVQSKGAGLTSISSTISHYQFNRRRDDL